MDPPPVQYVTTSDGYNIAYCVAGIGPTLIFLPAAIHHLTNSVAPGMMLTPLIERLAANFRLVRYDSRGQGLSSRGLRPSHSCGDYESDLAAVMDKLGPEPVILMAAAAFTHVAGRYAVRNAGRVRALVLYRFAAAVASYNRREFTEGMAATDWDHFLATFHMSVQANATISPEQRRANIARLKQATTQEDWLASARAVAASNITGDLPLIRTPVLVIAEGGGMLISQEETAKAASLIPGARLIVIDSDDVEDAMLRAILDFADSLPAPLAADVVSEARASLSAREIEVLRLIAAGKTNPQIADTLVISRNTVQNHVASILAKAGLANRAETAAYAQRHGLV